MTCKLDSEVFRFNDDLCVVSGNVEIDWNDGVCIPDVDLNDLTMILVNRDGEERVFDPLNATTGDVMLLIARIYKRAEEYGYDNYADYVESEADRAADLAYDSRIEG